MCSMCNVLFGCTPDSRPLGPRVERSSASWRVHDVPCVRDAPSPNLPSPTTPLQSAAFAITDTSPAAVAQQTATMKSLLGDNPDAVRPDTKVCPWPVCGPARLKHMLLFVCDTVVAPPRCLVGAGQVYGAAADAGYGLLPI
jgi:hypothetical protein